jgi:hypothetical protein
MNNEQIVITVYGHDKTTIDNISICLFDNSETKSNAKCYCNNINGLELKDDAWIYSKIITEKTLYSLDAFFPLKFDILLNFDDFAIQKIIREVDSWNLALALKGANEAIQDKIFKNLSERAANMLKEDMKYMGPISINAVREKQEKILDIVRRLEQTGEIIIPYS